MDESAALRLCLIRDLRFDQISVTKGLEVDVFSKIKCRKVKRRGDGR